MSRNSCIAGRDGGGEALQDNDRAANTAKVDEVTSNQSLEKGNDDEEELSDNVDATKDSREADRILLGEEDEIFNNAIDFTYLIIKLLTE